MSKITNRNSIFGTFSLLLAQLMIGVCIVGSKSLLDNYTPYMILAVRFTIGFIFLLCCHFFYDKNKTCNLTSLTKKDWLIVVVQAICAGALFNILLLAGLQYTSATVAGIIASTLPALIAILAIFVLKETPTFFTTISILAAVIGLIIINLQPIVGKHSFVGDLLILAALLPESFYYILSKKFANKLPVFLVSGIMNGINIPIFLIPLMFHLSSLPALTLHNSLLFLMVGIGSALFYVFWYLGYKNVTGIIAGSTTAFMPVATLTLAWVFLYEVPSVLQLFCMSLIIISIMFGVTKTT